MEFVTTPKGNIEVILAKKSVVLGLILSQKGLILFGKIANGAGLR